MQIGRRPCSDLSRFPAVKRKDIDIRAAIGMAAADTQLPPIKGGHMVIVDLGDATGIELFGCTTLYRNGPKRPVLVEQQLLPIGQIVRRFESSRRLMDPLPAAIGDIEDLQPAPQDIMKDRLH